MNTLFILVFMTILLWSFSVIVDKFCVGNTKLRGSSELTIIGFISLIPIVLLCFIIFNPFKWNLYFLLICFIIGSLYVSGMYIYLRALEEGDSIQVSVLLKSSVIILIILEIIVLGSNFNYSELSGMIIILLSSILVTVKFNSSNKLFEVSKVFYIMVIEGFIYSFRLLLMDIAVDSHSPIDVYSISVGFSIILCIIAIFLLRDYRYYIDVLLEDKKSIFWVSMGRNLGGLGTITYLSSIVKESVSIISVLTGTQSFVILAIIMIINKTVKDNSYVKIDISKFIIYIISIFLALIGLYLIYVL